ncbi:hypothetical protein [Cellulosimicrobium sp. CUA-896]|uniref:hypothetical protein n=1 Tax=Cellulosimicrobium sp. CUA-896 TaxID=1517881 RepID=UPI002100E652|nr:hypothetical protein [Cellulosimicrobium sp. CUA-896]
MTRNVRRSGLPKIARDTSCSTSMSNPSISPVNGLRAPMRSVSAETPTTSEPRSRISAMVLPAGSASGEGSGPSGA